MITLDASVWVAALNSNDPCHAESVHFLRRITSKSVRVHTPSYALVEIACALARRKQNAAQGREAMEKVRQWPQLTVILATDYLPGASIDAGLRHSLRAGDATYVAAAVLTATPLITWDTELIQRTQAITPTHWLTSHP